MWLWAVPRADGSCALHPCRYQILPPLHQESGHALLGGGIRLESLLPMPASRVRHDCAVASYEMMTFIPIRPADVPAHCRLPAHVPLQGVPQVLADNHIVHVGLG